MHTCIGQPAQHLEILSYILCVCQPFTKRGQKKKERLTQTNQRASTNNWHICIGNIRNYLRVVTNRTKYMQQGNITIQSANSNCCPSENRAVMCMSRSITSQNFLHGNVQSAMDKHGKKCSMTSFCRCRG
jgi:hypothetical protein